jgi:hypothetical protein
MIEQTFIHIPGIGKRTEQELWASGIRRWGFSLAQDIAVLREQMGTDGLDLDAFLDQIVKHARALTRSNGAAVALRHGTVILCRARCGETSPSLGAQLDADFGISGECLRTGKALRCEDSERDLRLDPEVCRQLGLRSIALVPIFESTTVAGILEVFASQPHAFDDRDLEILQQLAELVTTVSGRVTQENQDTISEGILEPRSEARQEIPVAEVNSYALPSRNERLRKWTAPIALRRYCAQQSQFSRQRACSQRGRGSGRRLLHHGSITLQQLQFSRLLACSQSSVGSRGTERKPPSSHRRRRYCRPRRCQQVLQQWKLAG